MDNNFLDKEFFLNGRFGEKRKIFETLDGEEIWKGEKILRIRNMEYRLKKDWKDCFWSVWRKGNFGKNLKESIKGNRKEIRGMIKI